MTGMCIQQPGKPLLWLCAQQLIMTAPHFQLCNRFSILMSGSVRCQRPTRLSHQQPIHPCRRATSTHIPPTDTPVPTATIATAPGKPTNLSALIAANGIWLSWTAPSDDIDGYQILRRRPRMGEGQLLIHVENTGNNNTSYLDTDVSGDDEKYVYRVKAIRAGMFSNRSKFIDVYVLPGLIPRRAAV